MHKLLLVILLLLHVAALDAQPVFYGVGGHGNGSIIKYDVVGDSLSQDFTFRSQGNFPGPMMLAKNGLLYGGTSRGGAFGYGVLFSYDPVSGIYSVLRSFNTSHGTGRKSKLCEAANGVFFGFSSGSGSEDDHGLIFSYAPRSNALNVLHRFTPEEYEYTRPSGTMVLGKDGNVYGTTQHTVFRIDPGTATYTTVYKEPNYANLFGMTLTSASNGLLYGTTFNEEEYTRKIFSFSPASSTLTYLSQLNDIGFPPYESLGLTEANGRLYGANERGIYSFNMSQKMIAQHVSFDPGFFLKLNGFTFALDGMLYSTGTIRSSENYGDDDIDQGILYRFNPITNSGEIVKSFGQYNQLSEELVQLPNAKWYSTFSSKDWSLGSVVTMDYTFTPFNVYRFRQNLGAGPRGPLIDNGGVILYGVNAEGGTSGKGLLYSFNVRTKEYKILKNFTGRDGDRPVGGLRQGKDGKLYGLTTAGGKNGYGTLFSFDVLTSNYTLIKSFDLTSGGNPEHGLISDANGVFYGMTNSVTENPGPTLSYLYSYNPVNNQFSILSRNVFRAAQPVFGTDGKIYQHIAEQGFVFKYDPVTKSTQQYLVPANVDIGRVGWGALHQAPNGLFYGMTSHGTTNENGTLFSFNAVNGNFKVLFPFSRTDGNGFRASSTLMTGSNGLLYGHTSEGGAYNMGTLFSFDTKLNLLKKLQDFNEPQALGSSLIELNLPPFISITDKKVYESDGQAILTVSLSKPSIYNIVVQYHMKSGSAISWGTNPDYIGTKRKLIFSAGMLKANITVPILKDQVAEPQEWLNVVLTNLTPTRAALGDSIGIVTINDGTRPSTVYNASEAIEEAGKPNEQRTAAILSLRALPNPTRSMFSFEISTMGNKPAQLRIYDQVGRTIEMRSGLRSGRLSGIGSSLLPGIYFAELKQGSEIQVIKLVKE